MDFLDRDDKKVELKALYGDGRPGQTVVLARVSFGPDHQLYKYPQPSVFTIVDKVEGKKQEDGYYLLLDPEGDEIKIQDKHYGASLSNFYDANAFLQWDGARVKELMRQRDRKEQNQKMCLDLLIGILEKQGVRIITSEQAKALGIEFPG